VDGEEKKNRGTRRKGEVNGEVGRSILEKGRAYFFEKRRFLNERKEKTMRFREFRGGKGGENIKSSSELVEGCTGVKSTILRRKKI